MALQVVDCRGARPQGLVLLRGQSIDPVMLQGLQGGGQAQAAAAFQELLKGLKGVETSAPGLSCRPRTAALRSISGTRST